MTDESDFPIIIDIIDRHIAVITLNRPRSRNAIDSRITQLLHGFVRQVDEDPVIRVAVLTSSHETVFCAGADLREIAAGRADLLSTAENGFAGFVEADRQKPWIAAVRGAALAGGCEIALACDMIVAADDASFGLPEVKRGLIAGAGGLYRLPRALPRNIALELIATGEPLRATDPRAVGLFNRIVPADEVLPAALALAHQIAANAPLSVVEGLRIARQGTAHPIETLRTLTAKAVGRVFASEDAKEGTRAFLEKRAPKWQGR
jgi:enoyl-CoA hydratase